MHSLFWQRLHGGSTHFPIVLLLLSVALDFIAIRSREETLRRGLQAAGLITATAGVLGGCIAVVSGLVMTKGEPIGSGLEKLHHLFIWPAFGLCTVSVLWRWIARGKISRRRFSVYLTGMSVASALTIGGAFWGGEMLLGTETKSAFANAPISVAEKTILIARGHDLFLRNCAHCHGDDALGTDEAPNLVTRDVSNARIASVIKNGIKGEMPRFNQKLHAEEVASLIEFLRSRK
jgi:mono/diheme cytochrome c family protein